MGNDMEEMGMVDERFWLFKWVQERKRSVRVS